MNLKLSCVQFTKVLNICICLLITVQTQKICSSLLLTTSTILANDIVWKTKRTPTSLGYSEFWAHFCTCLRRVRFVSLIANGNNFDSLLAASKETVRGFINQQSNRSMCQFVADKKGEDNSSFVYEDKVR